MSPFSVISDAGIEHLAGHKHVNYVNTPLDYLHEPWWAFCARITPVWISPNAISMTGGLSGVLSAICAVTGTIFDMPWLQVAAGVFIFIYMTADAVDGKHARATGQASPMGALVDHGVDAAIAFIMGLAICVTVGWHHLELNMQLMIPYCAFHSIWFIAQWAERQMGHLDTRGITEGELLAIIVVALPGVVPGIYQKMVQLPPVFGMEAPVPVASLVALGVLLWAGLSAVYQFLVVVFKRQASNWMPLFYLMAHNVVSIWLSTAPVYNQSSSLSRLLNFTMVGMNACLLMTKIRFVASTHSPWQLAQFDMLPFFILTIAQIVGVEVSSHCLCAMLLWQMAGVVLIWRDTISRLCIAFGLPFLAPIPKGWKIPEARAPAKGATIRSWKLANIDIGTIAVGAVCALCLSACTSVQ